MSGAVTSAPAALRGQAAQAGWLNRVERCHRHLALRASVARLQRAPISFSTMLGEVDLSWAEAAIVVPDSGFDVTEREK